MRVFIEYSLLLLAWASPLLSQDGSGSRGADLSSLTAEEARRGVYVFYSQSYLDKDNQRVSYRGSIYGAMQRFELNGCEVNVETIIVDKFSGTVGRAPTGQMQDTYRYSASFSLTPEIAAGAVVVEARPAQLGRHTHSLCEENPSCNLPWLQIEAKRPVIHEISSLNNAQNFDGRVDHFVLPISAPEMGHRLIGQLQAIADSRCR